MSDRYESPHGSDESDEELEEEEEKIKEEEDKSVAIGAKNDASINGATTNDANKQSIDGGDAFSNYSYLMIENEVNALGLQSNLIQTCRQLLGEGETLDKDPNHIITWDYRQVQQFVQKLTSCSRTAELFSDQVCRIILT